MRWPSPFGESGHKEQLALIMDCCSPPWSSLKSITVIYHNLMESAENGASGG